MKLKQLPKDDESGAFCCEKCYEYFTDYECYLGHLEYEHKPSQIQPLQKSL